MQWLVVAAAIGVIPPQPAPLIGGPAPAATRWWLENDGRPVGVPDADVDAERAWAITLGDPGVLVAIVDTGVDVAHPQLAAAIRVNPGEIPANGLDDEGNGFIDDVTGWDFADDDADPFDPFAIHHGTPVAGIVAGLAPGVSLLPVKIFSDSGVNPAFEQAAIDGIQYAIDEGAGVIQIAWTLDGAPGAAFDAVFAAAEAAGVVVVVAAGNDAQNLDASPEYPASYPTVVTVAGTDRYDRFVDLTGLFVSASGPATVELAAPTEKLTTASSFGVGGETLFTGTSAAAPLVSATAALMLSANSALTPPQVRAILAASGDALPSLEGRVAAGRLNAGNAVLLATGEPGPLPRAVLPPVERADPLVAILYEGRGSSGASQANWLFADRDDPRDAFVTEHRFRHGGLWPVTLEVVTASGLSHTAHTETIVPFRGTSFPRTDESPHPYPPGLQEVTVSAPGAVALRLHFTEIGLAAGDAIILYDATLGGVRAIEGSALDHVELVRGDTVHLHLRAYTGGGFGFALDRVDAAFEGDGNRPPAISVTGASGASTGTVVPFEATASDPDGDDVAISWRLLLKPDDSTASLSDATGETSSLTPDARGEYAIAVTASDGISETSTLTWIVTRERDDEGVACSAAPGRGSAASLVLLAAALALTARARRRTARTAQIEGPHAQPFDSLRSLRVRRGEERAAEDPEGSVHPDSAAARA